MQASICKPGLFALERIRYFPRQLLTADDMATEQDYFRQRDRRHNRFLHGFGVVCGLSVEAAPDDAHPWQVRVCPGYAIGPQGDEISVPNKVLFDLATGICDHEPCQPWPCPPSANRGDDRQERAPVYLAIRYGECDSRPVRVHPMGCGCDDTLCEYSRVRDDFELKVLNELPPSHIEAAALDAAFAKQVKAWSGQGRESPSAMPVPPCPSCPDDPWVVIARIHLPQETGQRIDDTRIDYVGRRVLYSANSLRVLALA